MVFRAQDAGSQQVPPSAAKSDPCGRSDWMYFAQWACHSLKMPTTAKRGGSQDLCWRWRGGGLPPLGMPGCLRQGARGKVEKPLSSSASQCAQQPSRYWIFSRLRLSASYVTTSIPRGWRLLPRLRGTSCLGPDCFFLQERSLGCKLKGKSYCHYPGNTFPAHREDSNLQDHRADALN